MAKTSALDSDIRSRIETFLAEISTMVRDSAFQAVREALGGEGGNGAPARRGPGRPRRSGVPASSAGKARKKTGRSGKRTSEEVDAMAEQLLAFVRANPGQGAIEIAKALRVTTKDVQLPVIKLLASRSIRTEGQRRGTKYFAGGRTGSRPTGGGGRKAKAQRKSKGSRKGSRKGARKNGRRGANAAASESSAAAAA